jgi:leucyl aminopeptidase (aminopeptidase T)
MGTIAEIRSRTATCGCRSATALHQLCTHNMPTARFTGPVESSVDGKALRFPLISRGEVDGVELTFKDGVETKASKNEASRVDVAPTTGPATWGSSGSGPMPPCSS